MPSVRSSCQVRIASRILRNGSREGDSHRFLASCWLMVEAPRGSSPSSIACVSAFRISPLSNPRCEKKLMSSATSTATFMDGAIEP